MTQKATQYSNYQAAIINWALAGEGNGLVSAGPGSGKTYTLVATCREMVDAGIDMSNSLFAAFNVSIKEELEKRLPKMVQTKTTHGLGMAALRKVNAKLTVDNYKYRDIITNIINIEYKLNFENDGQTFLELRDQAEALLNFAQISLCKPGDHDAYFDAMVTYDVNVDEENLEKVFSIVSRALHIGREVIRTTGKISFSDMIWGVWALAIKPRTYDFIMIDESQDMNAAQLELLRRSGHAQTRYLFVGDRSQAIYAFAGALGNSMDIIKEKFECTELPLKISYRCPKSVIRLAQQIDSSLEAKADAIEGSVNVIDEDAMIKSLKPGDMVLCRVNAPLVSICFRLIRNGIPATIRGRNIGKELASLVHKIFRNGGLTATLFNTQLNKYTEKQIEYITTRYTREDRRETAITQLNDKLEVIRAVYESAELKSTKELAKTITNLFSDEDSLITCSSIHRAKGLESKAVYIIAPERLPHPMAQTLQARLSESFVEYVAITRAIETLSLVGEYHRLPGLTAGMSFQGGEV